MEYETFLTITKVLGCIVIIAALLVSAASDPYGD